MTARTIVAVGAASVVLGVATTGLIALASGGAPPASASCEAPALAGAVVNVSLTDMGDMMGPGMMGPSGHMRGMGMMRVTADPATVSAGQISLRANNFGALTHEVVILPLAPGQWQGQRAIGADGEVDESGSLGEASRTCGADEGEGILPGASGWTTLTLPPGRYELLCNIAGHYGAGMYTELDVTGNR